jgi:oligoribonuclease NrnB/cAMP/cGMP phosphodiesterase (DHH superfamily)
LAILTFSKRVVMSTLRYHIKRVKIEYKEDKMSIMNGKSIKERRVGPNVCDDPFNTEESKNKINLFA